MEGESLHNKYPTIVILIMPREPLGITNQLSPFITNDLGHRKNGNDI